MFLTSSDVPERPEKRYGTNPGSGTVLPPFLALGRFKLSSSFLVSYHEGSLIWTKSELEMVLFHSNWAGSHWHTGLSIFFLQYQKLFLHSGRL